jgi:hypothetical protein
MAVMTLSKRHDALENKVRSFIIRNGGKVYEKTYHDGHIRDLEKQRIQRIFTPTGLFIRAYADRWALMPNDLIFFFECKTSNNEKGSFEALPLFDHMTHSKRGILCLYCGSTRSGREFGFWTHNPPPFDCLMIPPQRERELFEWYDRTLPDCFPKIQRLWIPGTVGSNDPFVLVSEIEIEKLTSWDFLITEKLRDFSSDRFR